MGCLLLLFCMDFNPRSREGSDLKGIAAVCLFADFNPRSREGSDAKAGGMRL